MLRRIIGAALLIYFVNLMAEQIKTRGQEAIQRSLAEEPMSLGRLLLCEDQSEILKILRGNKLETEKFRDHLKSHKTLIFAGDAHSGSRWEDDTYVQILNLMPSGGSQCLFLEQDQIIYQKELQICNEARDGAARAACKVSDEIMWRKTIQAAVAKGWQVFAIDDNEGCQKANSESSIEAIRCRNKYMSQRIAELKSCEGGMAIVGTAHIDRPILGADQTIIGLLAEATRFQIRTFNMKSTYALRWNLDCGHDLSVVENYWGKVKSGSFYSKSDDVKRFFGDIWPVDFDYVIFGGKK